MDTLLIFAKLNDLRLINRAGGLYGPVGNVFVGGEYHDPTLTQFVTSGIGKSGRTELVAYEIAF